MHHVNNISVLVSTVRSMITNLAGPTDRKGAAHDRRVLSVLGYLQPPYRLEPVSPIPPGEGRTSYLYARVVVDVPSAPGPSVGRIHAV
jgi:hypothetical protein